MTDVEFCQRVAAACRHALIMSAAAAALVLAGCSTTAPIVPAQLLTCAAQPTSPAGATQRDLGLYLIDLAAAGDDCRTKFNAVRGLLTPET